MPGPEPQSVLPCLECPSIARADADNTVAASCSRCGVLVDLMQLEIEIEIHMGW
jgi:hypothetical protein